VNLLTGVISGADGADTLNNIEYVMGSAWNDTLIGNSSDNYLRGGLGNDRLDGEAGFDSADYGNATGSVEVNLTTGLSAGADGVDILRNIEAVRGSAYDDKLVGGLGNNVLDGGAGFDLVQLWLENHKKGAMIKLGAGTVVVDQTTTGIDTLISIESLVGTDYSDVYSAETFGLQAGNGNYGSSGLSNSFHALRGNDTIIGNGATTLFLGIPLGNTFGGVQVDLSQGWAKSIYLGKKTIQGGVSAVEGTSYADVIKLGDKANDWVEMYRGTLGSDTIDGGSGYDRVEYTSGTLTLTGLNIDLGAGRVTGKSNGVDTLRNIEGVYGSQLNDTFDARGYSLTSLNAASETRGSLLSPLANNFQGANGNDTIYGNGQTILRFDGARAAVYANLITGQSYGLDGTQAANIGADTFSGVNGFFGSAYSDSLVGGNALNDALEVFRGAGGNDTIDGGRGWDMARFDTGSWIIHDGQVKFAVDASGNKISSQGMTFNMAQGVASGGLETDTLRSVEAIWGTVSDDIYDARGFGATSLNAGSLGTLNQFEGHFGNDTVIGNGNTKLSFSQAYAGVTVDFTLGQSYSSQYLIDNKDPGLVGVDTFSGVNAVQGSQYDDIFYGSSLNEDFSGGRGDELISAGAGNDTLNGGYGSDTLQGGLGNDVFDYNSIEDSKSDLGIELIIGMDLILDFVSNFDLVDLSGIDANTNASGDQTFTFNNTTAKANSVWYESLDRDGDSDSDIVVVYGDVNGDTTADFQIGLMELNSMTNVDFIL
jgi:Ca2+-binding RTX toxin-like protein